MNTLPMTYVSLTLSPARPHDVPYVHGTRPQDVPYWDEPPLPGR